VAIPELRDRRTTSDQIADALRDAILTGEFEDGEELNQVTLAKHFGTSRVPLREALRQLQAEGLVSSEAHKRVLVTALSVERVVEILDIRALLEGHLLAQAMQAITPEHVQRLERLCNDMDRTVAHQAWLRKNREFHQALYEPSGSSFTINLVEQLSARVERYLHMWSERGIQRNKEANAEHWAIVQAIKAKNARGARLELETHIAHTKDRVVERFGSHSVKKLGDSATR
jgi:DNA-binding GntR family transcriptional regulator